MNGSAAVLAAIAMTAAAVLAAGVCLAAPSHSVTPPVVQLVESRPVETSLGDIALPATAGVWRTMIDSARVSIDLEQFYISTWPGEALEPVIEALRRAAARGVRVRILVDERMHGTYPQPVDDLALLPHFYVGTIGMGALGGVQHAKYFIVDGREFFLGSQNFDWRSLAHIHELGVRVESAELAAQLSRVYDTDWARRTSSTPAADSGSAAGVGQSHKHPFATVKGRGKNERFTLTASPRAWLTDSLDWDRDAIVRVLDGARRTLTVQLLTFAPDSRGRSDATLVDAVRRAAARGVSVRLLISEWETAQKGGMAMLRSLAQLPHVEVKLSTLPQWSGGYIPFARVEHCKYAVADETTLWIGTSNWDPSYFHSSRNIGLTCANSTLAPAAARVFAASWFAPSAAPLDLARTYAPLQHGMTSPDGSPVYGK